MAATIIDPLDFCSPYPFGAYASENQVVLEVSIPFGVPGVKIDITSCEGIYAGIGQLQANLAFVIPILKIAGCVGKLITLVLKVVEILSSVPDVVTDPAGFLFKVTALNSLLPEIADCGLLFINFSMVLPVPNPVCLMVYGLLSLLVAVLRCIVEVLTLRLANNDQITALQASGDLQLMEAAECLIEQQKSLDLATSAKLDGVQMILNIINTLVEVVPPLGQALSGAGVPLPIVLDTTGGANIQPQHLADLADSLAELKKVVAICAFVGGVDPDA